MLVCAVGVFVEFRECLLLLECTDVLLYVTGKIEVNLNNQSVPRSKHATALL